MNSKSNKIMLKTNKLRAIYKAMLLFFVILSAIQAFAGDINDIINREMVHRDQILKEMSGKFNDVANSSNKKTRAYQQFINTIKDAQTNQSLIKNPTEKITKVPKVMVFVSFSMPTLSMQQIIKDGARFQVPVVMRGLYHNSFQETASKLFDLVKENNQGGVMIDPLWFRKFNITSVPAFVVAQDDKFDVIYGNISLKSALELIAEKGDMADIAKEILKEHSNE